jgi:hypothetical protein
VKLPQHLGVAESPWDATDLPVEVVAPAEGLSAFLGRVLNQLSLSAWFPAAMLVGSLAVLLQLRAEPDRDVVKAVTRLASEPLGLLILLLFALVLATIITQAFEFEVIRLLEGYWGDSLVAKSISRPFVARQRYKLNQLPRRRAELMLRAFRRTKPFLREHNIMPINKEYLVFLIEEDLKARVERRKVRLPVEWSAKKAKKRTDEADSFNWKQFAPADLMGRVDAVEAQIDEYPRPHRLLPTKLGNVLRAVEDDIATRGEELESFVISRWDETPRALQKEHDQYRTRLDMYCMLVFVFFVLAIFSPIIITDGSRYLPGTVATSIAYLFMSCVSYSAAVASARGYGTALRAIAQHNRSVSAQLQRRDRG